MDSYKSLPNFKPFFSINIATPEKLYPLNLHRKSNSPFQQGMLNPKGKDNCNRCVNVEPIFERF